MLAILGAYLAAAVTFLLIDIVWFGVAGEKVYFSKLDHVLRRPPNLGVAALFYILYIIGLVYFGVMPGLEANSVVIAAAHGALFGFFAYSTYDLTNLATIRDWPLSVAVTDIVWGTFLSAVSASAGAFAALALS